MFSLSKTYGFQILGPFYVVAQFFGLLLVREVNNKVLCFKTDGENDAPGGGGGGEAHGNGSHVFSPDRRFVAYNVLVMVWFYWTFRRCVSLAGGWPCADAESCSVAFEWTVTAAGAAQTVAAVAVATVHRRSRTAALLNHAHDVLRALDGGAVKNAPRPHVSVAGAYAATAMAIALVRSAAVAAARPDRFRVADVLTLCVPVAAAPIAGECVIVCACSAAEHACRDVADRLDRMAARRGRGPPVRWQLEAVWRDHWRGCRLVDHLSRCYGLDLAVGLTANMLLFIAYAYVTLVSAWTAVTSPSPDPIAAVYWNVALACQLACVSFRIVFISYRAEKIKQAGSNLVLISLRNLLKQNNLDISTIMLINAFTHQIMNREIKISACGFFSVNLSFFHALIRLATTYLIVIIQYNSDSLQTSPKTV